MQATRTPNGPCASESGGLGEKSRSGRRKRAKTQSASFSTGSLSSNGSVDGTESPSASTSTSSSDRSGRAGKLTLLERMRDGIRQFRRAQQSAFLAFYPQLAFSEQSIDELSSMRETTSADCMRLDISSIGLAHRMLEESFEGYAPLPADVKVRFFVFNLM